MQEYSEDEAAVSSVVSVVLMVAIVVLLSAVIAQFALGMNIVGDSPRASVQVDQSTTSDGETVVALDIVSMRNSDYVSVVTASGVPQFKNMFEQEVDEGLMYRSRDGYVEWAEETSDGKNKQYMDVPSNSGTVDVTIDFEAHSYEGSGAAIYAVDSNGDTHIIKCDGQGDGTSRPADMSDPSFTCDNEGANFRWHDTVEVTAPAEIERVYLVTDVSNTDGEWYDGAIFRDLTVTSSDNSATVSSCVVCTGLVTSTDNWNHDEDSRYGPSNDADEVGEVITVSNVQAGQSITVLAGKDGSEQVILDYEVK